MLSTPSDHHLLLFIVPADFFAHHQVEQLHRNVPQQARVQQAEHQVWHLQVPLEGWQLLLDPCLFQQALALLALERMQQGKKHWVLQQLCFQLHSLPQPQDGSGKALWEPLDPLAAPLGPLAAPLGLG